MVPARRRLCVSRLWEMRRWDARRPLNALLQRYTLLAPVHPNLAAVGAIPVQKNGCSVGSNLVQHAL
jgi:hypothetical protein